MLFVCDSVWYFMLLLALLLLFLLSLSLCFLAFLSSCILLIFVLCFRSKAYIYHRPALAVAFVVLVVGFSPLLLARRQSHKAAVSAQTNIRNGAVMHISSYEGEKIPKTQTHWHTHTHSNMVSRRQARAHKGTFILSSLLHALILIYGKYTRIYDVPNFLAIYCYITINI